jgi:formylglycine-generating enzyme required for sulfatase activity
MRRGFVLAGLALLGGAVLADSPAGAAAGKPARVLVPAGPFSRGSTRGADDERPVRVRTLPAFHIDRT